MTRRTRGTLTTLVLLSAVLMPVRAWAQRNDPQAVAKDAERQFRQHVNDYQARIAQLNFSVRPNAASRKGMNATIVNAYRSQLAAMARVRNESDAKIAHMTGTPAPTRNSAIRSLGLVFTTETRTLRRHEEDARKRLHDAARR